MGCLIQGLHLYRRVRFPPSRPTNYFRNPITLIAYRSGRSKLLKCHLEIHAKKNQEHPNNLYTDTDKVIEDNLS